MKTWLALPTALLALGSPCSAPAADAPAILVTAASAPIQMDGRLTEDAWRQAAVIADLAQQNPHPGAATPYHTEVRLLRDHDHLYLGISCTDPDPDRIAIHSLGRDSDQTNDDHITLVLDTFGTRQIGYVLQVNAGGARTDGLIAPANATPDYDWNGIWDAAVARTAQGWSAEISVDTRSLQFRPGLDRWGFNVQRYIPRDQTSVQWAGISLDASIFDLQRAGDLSGVAALEGGAGIEFSPYALLRDDSIAGPHKGVGAELRYDIQPDLAAILTLNPDFAEAEADTQQINLTQYPLFITEKRPFFLEGSNQFAFASGLDSQFIPFYSRRIGLSGGDVVRLDEGLKVIGTAGPWSIGALDVQTGESAGIASENLFAGHLTYDLGGQFRAGALVTHGDPTGQTNNTFTGADAVWQTATLFGDKNLSLSGWAGRSSGNLPPSGRTSGWGFNVDTPNDLWRVLLSWNLYGDALDPALGFLPRPGTRQYEVYGEFKPRPQQGSFDWVRQFDYQADYVQVDSLAGTPQSKTLFTALVNIKAQTGEHYEFDWIPEYQAVTAPFPIAPGVTIPAGEYRFRRYLLQLGSSAANTWQIGINAENGGFYDGRLTQLIPFLDWNTPDGRLALQFNSETDLGYLPEGDFIERLQQLKATYSFTPDFDISSFIQYNSTLGHTGVNAILHWIPEPGRDLFIVLNHGIETFSTTAGPAPLGNTLIVKLRWDLRG